MTFSNFNCKLRFFWYFQSETLSQYLLLALAIERIIAFYLPMAVRRWATNRNAWRLIAVVILFSIIVAAPSLYYFSLKKQTFSLCNVDFKNMFKTVTSILFNVLLCSMFPTVAVLTCALIMSYKINSVSKIRRQLQPQFGVYCDIRRPRVLRVVPLNNSAGNQMRGKVKSVQRQGANASQQLQELKLAKSLLVLATLEVFM